jgi:Cellulase (glycosyl hydrolase family 5)
MKFRMFGGAGSRAVSVGAALVVALGTAILISAVLKSPAGSPPSGPATHEPASTPQSAEPASTPQSAPKIDGWITASASGIQDDSGKAVRLLGVGYARLNQCVPVAPSEAEVRAVQHAGFNSVRLSVSWAATEPEPPTRSPTGAWVHHWNSAYVKLVDQAVSRLRAADIAVILDVHQVRLSSSLGGNPCHQVGLPGWLFSGQLSRQAAVCDFFSDTTAPAAALRPYEALSAVWQFYAKRYAKSSTVIGADIYNEPYVVDACPDALLEDLPRFYSAVGSRIREVNSRIALIVEDVAYQAYRKVGLQLTSLPDLPNVIYSWHFYASSWAIGQPELADHLAHARALGVPLWLGEFDAFGATSNDQPPSDRHWQDDLAAMLAYCRDNDIGWSLWELRGTGSSLIDSRTGRVKQPLARDIAAGF